MASPASTSPPTVFKRIRSPSTFSSSSIIASFGRTCSYFVVLLCDGAASWPSTSPMIVRSSIRCLFTFWSSVNSPISLICSFSFSSLSKACCLSFSISFSDIKNTSMKIHEGILRQTTLCYTSDHIFENHSFQFVQTSVTSSSSSRRSSVLCRFLTSFSSVKSTYVCGTIAT